MPSSSPVPLHFRLADATTFEWPGVVGRSYSEAANFPRCSAARFLIETHHGRVETPVSDRTYLILDGLGWFEVAGEKFEVTPNDVVIVPRGTAYDYGGKMEVFLVHSPAYDRDAEIGLAEA